MPSRVDDEVGAVAGQLVELRVGHVVANVLKADENGRCRCSARRSRGPGRDASCRCRSAASRRPPSRPARFGAERDRLPDDVRLRRVGLRRRGRLRHRAGRRRRRRGSAGRRRCWRGRRRWRGRRGWLAGRLRLRPGIGRSAAVAAAARRERGCQKQGEKGASHHCSLRTTQVSRGLSAAAPRRRPAVPSSRRTRSQPPRRRPRPPRIHHRSRRPSRSPCPRRSPPAPVRAGA